MTRTMTRFWRALFSAALIACSSRAPSQPGGTPDGPPGADPPSTDPSTTVTGTWFHRYHQHSGDLDVPVQSVITAWIPDRSPSGFRVLSAVQPGDGSFSIASIPVGQTYMLHVFDLTGTDVFYATDQRVIELHDESAIRHRPPPAILSTFTPLTLDVTGMTPYATKFDAGDSIEIDSFEIGYRGFDRPDHLRAGDTAIAFDHDWHDANSSIPGIALPDGDVGDEVEIAHYRTERSFTRTLQVVATMHLADLLRARLTLVNGMPETLTAAFPSLTADRKVTVSIGPSFDTLTASPMARRSYRYVEISAHPLWAESPHHLTLFDFSVDLSQDSNVVAPLIDFPYADPLPASWKRTLTISDDQDRGFRYPGPISDANSPRYLSLRTRISTEYTGTVDTSTALERPSGVLLGGQDFLAGGKLAFDGQSPIALTWNAVPSATSYHLSIWLITTQYTRGVAYFYIDGTSVLIPASLFHEGDALAFILSAEQYPRATPGSLVPNGLPHRTTDLVSGRFRLTSHCGDGAIQPDEECDDGGETSACNVDCTLAQCGDGIRNAAFGEECDDVVETTGCTDTCARTLLDRSATPGGIR